MFTTIKNKISGLYDNSNDLDNVAVNALEIPANISNECEILKETIFDIIRNIKDPEKPETLEDLLVLNEDLVSVYPFGDDNNLVANIEFIPTIPHCSLATLIGLCIRVKLERSLPVGQCKIDILIKKGTHDTADEINKQINDKERIAAAMENPNLNKIVEQCIEDKY